jgi:hypothetical protein
MSIRKALPGLSLLAAAALVGALGRAQIASTEAPRGTKSGLIYQPAVGSIWDPTVIYANGAYYMYSMYGGDGIWLATSADGVHWKDYGVVLKSQGFKNNRVWKAFVRRVGDRFILNHGAFTDQNSNNNLLRFWESKDLVHWTYLYEVPIDPKFYRSNGRWDHMYMIPKNDADPSQGYLGYVVADPIDHGGFGMMESPDGIHYTPIKAPEILADFRIPTMEDGGVKKIGSKYYFIGGNVNHHGNFGYGVYTFVADSPTGPFRPDLEAYRLTGTSGMDGNYYVHILTCFVQDSAEDLVSDPFSFRTTRGTDGQGTWFLPMRRAVVDVKGHLHLGYWKQNDLAKGDAIQADPARSIVSYPPGQTPENPIVQVEAAGNSLRVNTDKPWRQYQWLDGGKTRKAIVPLNQRFDLEKGLIVEGRINAKTLYGLRDARKTYAGFYIESAEENTGTGILLEVGEPQWRESVIGKIHTDVGFNVETLDITRPGDATVTGLDDGKDHTFRLWIRGGQVELYVDDLLMQTFFYLRGSGRIGFICQESDVKYSDLKFFRMNF